MFYINQKNNDFVDMAVTDYNLVIEEKDKIIENLSNKLDEHTEKLNHLKNSMEKFLNKNNFKGFNDLDIFLEKHVNFLKKYEFNNLEEADLFIYKYKHEEKEKKNIIEERKIENNNELIKIQDLKIDKADNTFNNLLDKYYNYERNFIPICIKNTKINKNIKGINKSINKKDIENANIIYNMFSIYYKFLNDNEKKLNFEQFLEYNKNNYKFIELSVTRIKDKYKRCYDIFPEIVNSENKNTIINILSRFKLSYSKIYKFQDKHRNKIKMFISWELNKIDFSNICNIEYNDIKETNKNNYIKADLIKEIISDIPFSYVGNKKTMIINILEILKQINKPIDKFIELFSGSMVLSYIIKYINNDIEITCYENNPYLINFYEYISNDLEDFIKDLEKELNIINNYQNKNLYIKNILKSIDTLSNKNMGMWYFILINVSHCNIISYKTKGISSITFNNKELDRLMKLLNNGNLYKKLKKYSDFIKTIKINNVDITQNYHEIIKEINNNSFLYIDSPYYNNNSNKLYYSNFNVNEHIELNKFVNIISKNNILCMLSNSDTVFIENLYNNFNINKFSVKFNINRKDRKELLITNFRYNKA